MPSRKTNDSHILNHSIVYRDDDFIIHYIKKKANWLMTHLAKYMHFIRFCSFFLPFSSKIFRNRISPFFSRTRSPFALFLFIFTSNQLLPNRSVYYLIRLGAEINLDGVDFYTDENEKHTRFK